MAFYRRLIYEAFRCCNRKNSPVESFCSRSNPPILRNSDLQNAVNKNQKKSPFAAKKFYSADRNKVPNAKAKAWYDNEIIFTFLSFLGAATVVYYWNLETVPYTQRMRFMIYSPCREKRIGGKVLKKFKSEQRKFLDSDHPESIRVEKIVRDIIGGLRKGLNKLEDGEQTAHLEEFEWEIFVVDDLTIVNAECFPGGKMVVFTGLLNYLETDAEIAIVIGHEVGHAVARHYTEHLSSSVYPFPRSSWRQRIEMEADYIGLIISASAGYDPRIAPEVYVKLDEHAASLLDVNLSTHPNGKKRAQLLSQPKVMDEALSIYTEALKDKEK